MRAGSPGVPGPASGPERYLARWADAVERRLDELLPPEAEPPGVLHRAMRYSTLGGGKRLRAVLAVAGCEAVGGPGERALDLAASLEMIHAYSLIHDDLPAMDDDDFRRGKPSCHRVFGEGMAILAGDALQSRAFEVLAGLASRAAVRAETALAVVGVVAEAVGSRGMAGGQAEDLLAEGAAVGEEQVRSIHRRKTAALIRASVVAGGLLGLDQGGAGLFDPRIEALGRFGEAFGLAFQIVDDLLDAPHSPSSAEGPGPLDKPALKATYPRAVGLAKSREAVTCLTEEAVRSVATLQAGGAVLAELARMAARRTR